MSAGQLRERVTLLTTASALSDGRGGFTPAGPATELELYARVEPLRTSEKLALGQVLNDAAFRITIRYRSDVSAKCRVRWGAHTLNVQGVTSTERSTYLLLTCFNSGK